MIGHSRPIGRGEAGAFGRAARRRGPLLVLAALLTGWAPARAAEIDRLEDSVREWIALRRELNRAQTGWAEQKLLLGDELRMLETQRAQLTRKLQTRTEAAEATAATLAEESRNKASVEADLATLREPLRRAEAHLRTWRKRLPDLLLAPLRKAFDKLPDEDAAAPDDYSALAERLQLAVGLYGQIEQLDRSLHAGKIVLRDDGGRELEMDVLFLGLAIGYAVSADGARAAVGRPAAPGWSWEWDPQLAPAVSSALACYRKEIPATFVDLPLRIQEEAK